MPKRKRTADAKDGHVYKRFSSNPRIFGNGLHPTVPYMENDPCKMKEIAEALRLHCVQQAYDEMRKYK